MNKQKFMQMMQPAIDQSPNKPARETLDFLHKEIGHLEEEVLQVKLNRHLRTSQYFPTLSQLLEVDPEEHKQNAFSKSQEILRKIDEDRAQTSNPGWAKAAFDEIYTMLGVKREQNTD